jgi:hypothetical protein
MKTEVNMTGEYDLCHACTEKLSLLFKVFWEDLKGRGGCSFIGNLKTLKTSIISWQDEKVMGSSCGIRKAEYWRRMLPSIRIHDLY